MKPDAGPPSAGLMLRTASVVTDVYDRPIPSPKITNGGTTSMNLSVEDTTTIV